MAPQLSEDQASQTMETTSKPVRAIILDAGPIIKGEPAVSTLLGQCEELLTTTSVIDEIKDKATRTRLETILMPFLTMRSPKTSSVKFVSEFARKTGDFSVLSRTDIELLALAYEVECERNGGDWRLRKSPGQKRTNGPSPFKTGDQATEDAPAKDSPKETPGNVEAKPESAEIENFPPIPGPEEHLQDMPDMLDSGTAAQAVNPQSNPDPQDESGVGRENPPATEDDAPLEAALPDMDPNLASTDPETDEQDSDSDGWITPSNINRKQLEGASSSSSKAVEPKIMQVATITTDFAMQNVLLQMNLNLLSPNLHRVREVKTFILRCHACFIQVRDLTKQFCPRCGGPTLTRVSCSTSANGEFRLHLKANMQWNNRGNRFAVPKPVAGAANPQRVRGGGKGGWGNGLILSEDQKEFSRQVIEGGRQKSLDIMDPDYLPSILSGGKGRVVGKPKVGAGRNVNSRKR